MRPLVLTQLFYRANNIIMNKTKYQLQDIKDFFGAHKIVTLNQLKAALGVSGGVKMRDLRRFKNAAC